MNFVWIYCSFWIYAEIIPCETIVSSPMTLERNYVDAMERAHELDKLHPIVTCVQSIARGWFVNEERVPVLLPSFLDIVGLSESLFSGLQEEVVVYSVAENFANESTYQTAHSAVVLIRNSTDLGSINDLNNLCAPRCRFVICLVTSYENETSFLTEANEVVKALWAMWIATAVIVAPVAEKHLVAGSYAFKADAWRVPAQPEILGDCSRLGREKNELIFHELMLNHCRINITVFDCPPYADIAEEDGHPVVVGMEGDLFETVAFDLGLTLNRMNINDDNNDSVYDDLQAILDDPDGSDVVFCGMYWGDSEAVEYSIPYELEQIVWLVPSSPGFSLLGLVTPLRPKVWYAIIGLLILAGLLRVLLFKKLSILDVFGLVLGIALPRQPTSLSNRIQFASWVLFGYVITQSYLASLAGQLMNTNYQTIETMEELASSGITFGGTARHRDLFKNDDTEISRKIYDKYQVLSQMEYEQVAEDMKIGKNTSMALVVEMKISHVQYHPGPYDPHKLNEIIAAYPISLVVWKGLPYLDQINAKVSRLTEGGLVNHWADRSVDGSYPMVDISRSDELDILHLSPSFFLLLLGHAFSIVIFLIEIAVYAKKSNRFASAPGKGAKKSR